MNSTRRKVAIGAASGALVLLMASLPFLPFPMGIVAEAQHVYIDEIPAENRGAYVTTDDGVMQLFTWRVEPTEFPTDAPAFDPERIRSIAIVLKVFDPPENYMLYEYDTSHRVRWLRTDEVDGHLLLVPPRLSPGRYMLVVPTDSMYGGSTRHYFSITG